MAPLSKSSKTASAVATIALLTQGAVAAGFNGTNNIALYWGQNSYGQATGPLTQQSLAYYCANSVVDIIPMAFLVQVTSGAGGQPVINFANSASNCTLFPGTSLLDCPDIAEDITTCQQQYGKTILLSIGGATYSEGGFASEAAAEMAADLVWRTFGPVNSTSPGTDPSSSISTVISSTMATSTTFATLTSIPGATVLTTSTSIIAPTTSTTSSTPATTTSFRSTTTSTESTGILTTSTSTPVASTMTFLSSPTTTTLLQSTTTPTQSTTIVTTSASAMTSMTIRISSTMATTTLATPTGTQPPWNDRTTPQPGTTSMATQTSSFATTTPSLISTSSLAYSVTDVFPQAPTTVTTWEISLTTVPCSTSAAATPLSRRQSTTAALRPFHNAVVDGFDLDLETATTNFRAFALRLRQLMAADTDRPYYLTVAPQCPYPDIADNSMLNGGVPFDAIFVQFYNNYCSASTYPSSTFNFATWDAWARNGSSANPAVKVFLGAPAGETAGTGYLDAEGLKPVIEYCKGFGSFGGVMAWDASQAYANSGWIEGVKGLLGNGTVTGKKERRRAVEWMA